MIILVDGINEEKVHDLCVKLEKDLEICYYDCETCKNYKEYIKLMKDMDFNLIIENSWISRRVSDRLLGKKERVTDDEFLVLNSILSNHDGFAYFEATDAKDEELNVYGLEMKVVQSSVPMILIR